ncbi:MAG TPA: hypothetical protein QKA14_02695 [Candidatus Megaira endosymbiont of Hartmannula sinica]|nr:hypothetical protein [Candidatus Megaera endosymbiont of Hartmannula sinica]
MVVQKYSSDKFKYININDLSINYLYNDNRYVDYKYSLAQMDEMVKKVISNPCEAYLYSSKYNQL